MIVTEIRQRGKSERYYIYVDGDYNCILEAETLAKCGLKTGDEITEEYLESLRLESGKISAFDRAITYLERGMKTEKGMRDYLKEKGYLEETIENTISKLFEYGYLDDKVYAESYVKTYSYKKGKKLLKMELKSKGIDADIIDEVLEEIEDEYPSCKNAAEKFIKTKTKDDKLKQKLYTHLISKGFSGSDINKVIKNIIGGENEDWD